MSDIKPGREIKKVTKALREIDKTLPAKLRKDLKAAAMPIVAKAKANAKTIPVNSTDANKIRAAVARGVSIQVSTGKNARMRVITRMPEKDQAIIPRGFNSPKGFRHPVFGNREVWVTQIPKESDWFFKAAQSEAPFAIAAVKQVLRDAAKYVAKNGKNKV
jgi:hypothetical protein